MTGGSREAGACLSAGLRFPKPVLAANPNLYPAHGVSAWALVATGDGRRRDDALREIERLETQGRARRGVAYDETIIYAALGELDRGCGEALARASAAIVSEHDSGSSVRKMLASVPNRFGTS